MKHVMVLMALVCVIVATSCQKETRFSGPKRYQIDKIWGSLYPATSDTLRFYYNHQGVPDSIVRTYNDFRHAQARFFHDGSGRVSDVMNYRRGEEPAFETWHKLVYNGAGQIVTDTVFESGRWGAGNVPIPDPTRGYHVVRVVYNFIYDAQNRIVQQQSLGFDTTYEVTDYAYDEYQNLEAVYVNNIFDGLSEIHYQFDTLKSVVGTNTIWQFLSRDYSVNNKYPATTHTSYGLPTTFSQSTDQDWEWFFLQINAFQGTVQASYKKTH